MLVDVDDVWESFNRISEITTPKKGQTVYYCTSDDYVQGTVINVWKSLLGYHCLLETKDHGQINCHSSEIDTNEDTISLQNFMLLVEDDKLTNFIITNRIEVSGCGFRIYVSDEKVFLGFNSSKGECDQYPRNREKESEMIGSAIQNLCELYTK